MPIDWDETGSLRHVGGDYLVRTGALWSLVIAAIQGHEGSLEDLLITTQGGTTYRGHEIRRLALRPDRKRR
jgi:hypothetical protein